jgi:hypothetical protein
MYHSLLFFFREAIYLFSSKNFFIHHPSSDTYSIPSSHKNHTETVISKVPRNRESLHSMVTQYLQQFPFQSISRNRPVLTRKLFEVPLNPITPPPLMDYITTPLFKYLQSQSWNDLYILCPLRCNLIFRQGESVNWIDLLLYWTYSSTLHFIAISFILMIQLCTCTTDSRCHQ